MLLSERVAFGLLRSNLRAAGSDAGRALTARMRLFLSVLLAVPSCGAWPTAPHGWWKAHPFLARWFHHKHSPTRLTVKGSQLLTPGGIPIRLTGFNWVLPESTGATIPSDGPLTAGLGANVARIVGALWHNAKPGVDREKYGHRHHRCRRHNYVSHSARCIASPGTTVPSRCILTSTRAASCGWMSGSRWRRTVASG